MTAREQRIADLFQAGKSQREIGRLVGLSQPGTRKALLRLGLITVNNQGPGTPLGSCPHATRLKEAQHALWLIRGLASSMMEGSPDEREWAEVILQVIDQAEDRPNHRI